MGVTFTIERKGETGRVILVRHCGSVSHRMGTANHAEHYLWKEKERLRELSEALLYGINTGLFAKEAIETWLVRKDMLEKAPWAEGKHSGDCTDQPHTCVRCLVEEIEKEVDNRAKEIADRKC